MTVQNHIDAAVKDLSTKYYDGPDLHDILETHIEAAIVDATAELRNQLDDVNAAITQYRDEARRLRIAESRSKEAIEQWRQYSDLLHQKIARMGG